MISWAKYNQAADIYIPLRTRASADLKSNPTLASGDAKVSKDGGAFANLTTLPAVTPASGIAVKVALSATELSAEFLFVQLVDQTNPKEWEDQVLLVYTYGHASARHAFDHDSATVSPANGSISSSTFAAAAITAGVLANDCITAAKIATAAIDADAMAANSIGAAVIATGAITAAKFAAGAIDAAAIADSAIDAGAIADNAITAAKIATGAIDADAIADGAIDAGSIGAGAITSAKFAADAITAAAIQDGSITAAKIATGAIDADALASDAVAEIAAAIPADFVGSDRTMLQAVFDKLPLAGPIASWDALLANHTVDGSFGQRLGVIHAGTATAGGAATLTLAASASGTNDFFRSHICWLVGGTGSGQAQVCGSYIGAAKLAVFPVNWPITPDGTTKYLWLPLGSVNVGQMEINTLTAAAIATDAVTKLTAGVWNAVRATYQAANSMGELMKWLAEMTENDGGIRRLTTNALEQGPAGGGSGNVTAIDGSAPAAVALKEIMLTVIGGAVADVGASTTSFMTNLAEATTNAYVGKFVEWITGANVGHRPRVVSAFNPADTGRITVASAMDSAPANGDTFRLIASDGT